jgi:hypothetical protein
LRSEQNARLFGKRQTESSERYIVYLNEYAMKSWVIGLDLHWVSLPTQSYANKSMNGRITSKAAESALLVTFV